MLRMRVVAAHEHGSGERADVLLGAEAQSGVHAGKGVGQKRRGSTLLGFRADLLVVETRIDRDGMLVPAVHKGDERSVGAHEVVEAGRGNELAGDTPHAAALTVDQEQVARHDLGGIDLEGIGHDHVERAVRQVARGEQREQIACTIGGEALVHAAVHVDCKARDKRDISVEGHKTALDARALSHQHASGERKRAVEPGVVHHAAVSLGVQTHITGGTFELAIRLYLEAGGVGMRGRELEVVRGAVTGRSSGDIDGSGRGGGGFGNIGGKSRSDHTLTHTPGHNARSVALRVVRASRAHLPCGALAQVCETSRIQTRADSRGAVKHRGALGDEVEQVLGCRHGRGRGFCGKRHMRSCSCRMVRLAYSAKSYRIRSRHRTPPGRSAPFTSLPLLTVCFFVSFLVMTRFSSKESP